VSFHQHRCTWSRGGYPAAVVYPDKSNVCPHCDRVAAFDLCHTVLLSPEFDARALYAETVTLKSNGMSMEQEVKHDPLEVWLLLFRCEGCRADKQAMRERRKTRRKAN
jgi:hypothetical protein